MKTGWIDVALKSVLAAILLLVPTVVAVKLWSDPVQMSGGNLFVGLFTVGIFLNIAEVVFLIRAVIFPKNKKKWWLDE